MFGEVNLRYYSLPNQFLEETRWDQEKPLFTIGEICIIRDRGARPHCSGMSLDAHFGYE